MGGQDEKGAGQKGDRTKRGQDRGGGAVGGVMNQTDLHTKKTAMFASIRIQRARTETLKSFGVLWQPGIAHHKPHSFKGGGRGRERQSLKQPI